MAEVVVNLGQSQKALPKGTYKFLIRKAEPRPVKDKPNEQLLYVEAVCSEPEEFQNRVLFNNIMLTGDPQKTGWAKDRFLNAIGIETPSDDEARKNFRFSTEDVVGREFIADVDVDEQGRNTVVRAAYRSVEIWNAIAMQTGRELGPVDA